MKKIRPEVEAFLKLGRLPNESEDEATIKTFQDALFLISKPLRDEEAEELMSSFGDDNCYGLAWTLLYLIETAPDVRNIAQNKVNAKNEWILRLQGRSNYE